MKILNSLFIVDDDPITVFGMRKMLESIVSCDNIETFTNGKLAMEAIINRINNNQRIPDVIFLDLNMPIMDGWQFLEEFIHLLIRENIQINIVTSSIDTADYNRWQSYQIRTHHSLTYNTKPVRKESLAEILEQH